MGTKRIDLGDGRWVEVGVLSFGAGSVPITSTEAYAAVDNLVMRRPDGRSVGGRWSDALGERMDAVDNVMMLLTNQKPHAVRLLFPDAVSAYHAEWLARDVGKFWGHLDIAHRRKLVAIADAFYAEAR